MIKYLLCFLKNSKCLFIVVVFLVSTPVFSDTGQSQNQISINVLNLITTDLEQYPIGIEIKYSSKFDWCAFEGIVGINYGIENKKSDFLLYLEPRIRTVNNLVENALSGLYASSGAFIGFGTAGIEFESMQGFDLNIGYSTYINKTWFFDTSLGVQYPDFPLARTYRIHYIIPTIDYIGLRMNLGAGMKL